MEHGAGEHRSGRRRRVTVTGLSPAYGDTVKFWL